MTAPNPSRRRFIAAASGLIAGALVDIPLNADTNTPAPIVEKIATATEPFWGEHQGGILTRPQSHTYFAAFDLLSAKRQELIGILRDWTLAAARMTTGQAADSNDSATPPPDSGETTGLPPARLTLTFGFGPSVFRKDGQDRFGLSSQRPEALVDLPKFNGDQLLETSTGGDLSILACSDDPQVAFHAVRQLARLSYGIAQIRWAQTGFLPNFGPGQTPRNLMGFKDGTNNPPATDPSAMDKIVWVGNEGPAWMHGGTYLVARRIRIALEHWDRMNLDFQEQTIGRKKSSGAPLTGKNEFDPANLDATDKDGNSIIPDNAHIRLASAAANDGAQILRRPYSYNDGVNFTSERWPPWRQGMEYDAGLFFLAYQRDPRSGFIKIFEKISKLDMLNQFTTHTAGGLFACPPGVPQSQYIGQRLFNTA